MIDNVKVVFDQALVENFVKKQTVLKFLLEHPRKQKCLEKLCEQIKICERRQYKITFELAEYRHVIYGVAQMWANAALKKAEEDTISSLERTRREEESRRLDIAKETLKEYGLDGTLKSIISE